jgi:hypothetical protein
MASTFASYFGLRSTVAYIAGSAVPVGSLYTVSSNVGPIWSNTLTVSSFSTLLGSTITVSTIRYQSTAISLGASTNQSYTNFTSGSYAGWGSTLSGLTAIQKIAMSYSGQYQLVAQNGSSTINASVNSGISWVSITGANGLPAGATAYPVTTASGTPNYTSVSASATGQYILASVRGGLLYTCANGTASVPTFTAVGMGTPTIYAPFENAYTDVMAYSTMNATGSPAFVTGIVGSYAVNLANTAGGTATKYIKEGWPGSSNFTVSFWFNLQSYAGNLQEIFSAYSGAFVLFINTDNKLYWNVASGGGGNVITAANTSFTFSLSTWYNVTATFRTGGVCSLYVNNILIGSSTNSSGTGSLTCSQISIGCIDSGTAYAFNGYIDDFRLYLGTTTFSPIIPMNWAYTAVSGSGQYMLAAAAGGGLFISSDYGATWSQVTASITNPLYTGLGISYSGQYMLAVGGNVVTPQQSGLAAASWTQGGVSWTTSASSQYSTFAPQSAFNSSTATTWASNSGTYNGSGAWTGSVAATTIQGVGSISGEWLQLQSNVGLLMQSYTFSCGGPVNQTPKTYYIIGSNNGSTWFPIQYVSMGSNPYTTNYSVASTYITTNQSGSQNLVVGASTAVLTCTSYDTTNNPYTYFRILVTTTHGGGVVEIGEWYINFANGQNYSTNYGSTWTKASINGATQTFGALSGNGQYALTGTGQIAYLVSNYLAGFSTNTYTTLTLSGINANISCADLSATGQYMTILTQGTTNNVYYSTNYGATFTALTVGSAAMTDCAISADGSYITVSNSTTVYTLNRNTQGFAVSIGNAAGVVNQGQHAIAIGNQAGVTNQSANSIVLNSSGSTLDTYNAGFYVSNISDYNTSYAPSFSILGYGSDKQIVQGSAITLAPSGNVGIGTTSPSALLHVFGGNVTVNYGNMICLHSSYPAGGSYSIGGTALNLRIALNSDAGARRLLDIGYYTGDVPTGAWNSKMVVDPISGNVGIGMTAPTNPLQVAGRAIFGYIPSFRAGIFIDNETSYGTTPCIQGVSTAFGTNPITINPAGGNVGINTTSPSYNLHVIGTIYASGDITALSDQRYKQNIIRLDRSLDKVLQLSGYSYTRNDYRPGEKQIGFLAQEVLNVFPEAVSHDSTNDKYSLNYGCLIAPVVESIKELQDQITAQNQIIEYQGKTIQLLISRLNVNLVV